VDLPSARESQGERSETGQRPPPQPRPQPRIKPDKSGKLPTDLDRTVYDEVTRTYASLGLEAPVLPFKTVHNNQRTKTVRFGGASGFISEASAEETGVCSTHIAHSWVRCQQTS
jgi:hypothetical protein